MAKLRKTKGRGKIVRAVLVRVENTTNNITTGIINVILNDGYSASRINTQGQYDEHLKGYKEGGYRPSGARNGVYDVIACIAGQAVAIDVKKGDDELRPDQIIFKAEWEKAGGIAIEPKSQDEFLCWYFNFKATRR